MMMMSLWIDGGCESAEDMVVVSGVNARKVSGNRITRCGWQSDKAWEILERAITISHLPEGFDMKSVSLFVGSF